MLPDIARELDVAAVPVVASTLTIIAALTRIFAIPEVDGWMDRHFPWLSADPYEFKDPYPMEEYHGRHRAE